MNETSASDNIGTIIDDKYRIESLIGKGGMGRVYRVNHLQLNKIFALKVMHFDKTETGGSGSADSSQVVRFKRETEVLVKINHPNVVMVTDFGTLPPDDAPYIVMEYIEGNTLRQLMKEKGKLPEKQVIHIAKQICAGLHAAHSQSIVHRDLKPENVMIQLLADGEIMARVLDFGIAKLLQKPGEEESASLTGAGMPGTPKYMAPEQMFGTKVDARADVFAICLMIYEMLTGVLPLVLMSKVKPLAELRPDITQRLDEIVFKGIAKEPEDRHQSALDLKRALESLEQDSFVEAELYKRTGLLGTTAIGAQRPTVANRMDVTTSPGASSTVKITAVEPPPRSRAGLVVFLIVLLLAGGLGGLWAFSPQFRQLFTPPGTNSADAKLPESLIPQLTVVKGGKFQMGANKGDITLEPEHPAEVKAFQVSKFLVTNRQYAEFVKRGNHQPPKHWRGTVPPADIMDKPVTNVSWDDANDYCAWLSKQTDRTHRLLTEEEWEYVAHDNAHFGVNEFLDVNFIEWTGTSLTPYSGAKWTVPPDFLKAKIFRGESVDPDNKKVDPVTSRSFQNPDFSKENLGFRVACDAATGGK